MAKLIEAESNAFFVKCKGIAVILAAISGLTLGILNWFKEVRDPIAKSGYQETSQQMEKLSLDLRKLADVVRQQAEEINTIQNWIINERDKRGALPSPTMVKIVKQTKARLTVVAPPVRKPEPWEGLQVQHQGVRGN